MRELGELVFDLLRDQEPDFDEDIILFAERARLAKQVRYDRKLHGDIVGLEPGEYFWKFLDVDDN